MGGRCWGQRGRGGGDTELGASRIKHSHFCLTHTHSLPVNRLHLVPGGRGGLDGRCLGVLPGQLLPWPGTLPPVVQGCGSLAVNTSDSFNVLAASRSQPCSFLSTGPVGLFSRDPIRRCGKEAPLPGCFRPPEPCLPLLSFPSPNSGQNSWRLLRSVILTFPSSSGERGPTPFSGAQHFLSPKPWSPLRRCAVGQGAGLGRNQSWVSPLGLTPSPSVV